MSADVQGTAVPLPRERPPLSVAGPLAWARHNLFSGWLSTAVTLLLGYLLIRWAIGLFDWGVLNAIWGVPTARTAVRIRRRAGRRSARAPAGR